MKKFVGMLLTVMLIAALALTGCGQKPQDTSKDNAQSAAGETKQETVYPMTIKDDAGRTVELEKKPEKIIALGTFLNTLYDVGGKSIARCDVGDESTLPEGTKDLPTVGKVYNINMEKVVSLQPDLVITEVGIHDKYTSVLETNKIPVISLQMKTYDDVIRVYELLGKVCGNTEKADELIGNMKKNTEDIVSKLPDTHKKVVILYVTSQDVSVKLDNSIAGNVAQILKIGNIASGIKPEGMGAENAPFSMEKIVESDPDVILVTTMVASKDKAEDRIKKDLESNPAWSGLRAVKDGNIVYLPQNLFLSNPGTKFDEAVEYMAKAVYPEVYGNVEE